MTQILEPEKDVKVNIFETNGKFQKRNIKYKEKPNGNFRNKKYKSKNKKFTG